MAVSPPGGKWLFSKSVVALRDLKSRFEALDRDAIELSVVLLQVRKPCPDYRKLLPKEQQGICICPESALDALKWWLCDPDSLRQRHLDWKTQLASVFSNKARPLKTTKGVANYMSDGARGVNSSWSVGFRHPSLPETSREYLIYPDPDPDAARRLQVIAKDAAILIQNASAAFGPDSFRLLWPEIPVDSLNVGPGLWFDLVFEAGRWGLPSLQMRCCGRGQTEERLGLGHPVDIQPEDIWTNPNLPNILTIPLERFASKSAAVINLLIQWGETGVNPFESRLNAGQREQAGNELNFEFPPKTPNKYFRLEALNHAVKRLVDFLRVQVLIGIGDPAIGWDQEQWTEQYWPKVQTEMELIWASLPEDSRRLYPSGYEAYFEGFEDFLGEVKNRYFESFPDVPRYPVDESLRERLGQHADVLKGCPEPGETPKSVETQAGGDDAGAGTGKNGQSSDNPTGRSDTPKKNQKKSPVRKLRPYGKAERDCVKKFKQYIRSGDAQSMTYVVEEYVRQNKNAKFSTIYRALNDHSGQWKPSSPT